MHFVTVVVLWCLFCDGVAHRRKRSSSSSQKETPSQIRERIDILASTGQNVDLVEYLESIEQERGKFFLPKILLFCYNIAGSLIIDNLRPNLYNHMGVALHATQRIKDAENAFKKCVSHDSSDTR